MERKHGKEVRKGKENGNMRIKWGRKDVEGKH